MEKVFRIIIAFAIFICPIYLQQNWMWSVSWLLAVVALDEMR